MNHEIHETNETNKDHEIYENFETYENDEIVEIRDIHEPHRTYEGILYNDECYVIQGAVYEVYREMGTGFLESVY